jgi:hypothetical protein
MAGKFLEMGLFAVIASDGVGAAIYHDIDQGHGPSSLFH